jgi:5-methylcytosine-specific restriction protein B
MPKHDLEHLAATYGIAERFVEQGLRRDGSLFTPGRAIWSLAGFEELDRLYVQAPDPGGASFEEKLQVQIGGGSAGAIQLMAEILYVYYLPSSSGVTSDTKRARIGEILSWTTPAVALPDDLAQALDHGIGGGGVGFHTFKWASVSYFIRFGLAWKRLPAGDRERALADPWVFRSEADSVPTTGGGTYAHESLLHLVHPDTFERIFSRGEKWALADRLGSLVTDQSADVDHKIAQIRAQLETRFGAGFDFYWSVPVVAMWKPDQNRWTSFLYWAGRLTQMPNFDADERDYKLALAEALTPARQAVLAESADWVAPLEAALRSKDNNLIGWRETDRFLKWAAAEPEDANAALQLMWAENVDPLSAMGPFLERLPKSAVPSPGQRVCLASVLLMAVDPYRNPPYRPTPLQLAYKLTGLAAEQNDELPRYRAALAFFDEVLARAPENGLELRDRLDAQSATWVVTSDDVPASWPLEDRLALDRYRKGAGEIVEEPPEPPEPPTPPKGDGDPVARPSLGPLADELLIDEEELIEIAALLEAKHQLVFYGPPGTGKTFVARKLAATLAGDPARVRLVQFHPSYAYEDFVEGFRPRLIGGVAGFELVPGPLKRLAALAAADPAHLHFLVIDEMNRGNVAKVFGELYFLLEYRDEPVELQYSAVPFAMPGNLRIIGTMNTADRSIALLDAALRRRFGFIPFFPDREPIAGLLHRWLERHRPEMVWVAGVVDRANARLADRNGAIGPSFFLRADLDDARLGLIWKHEIMPYLEDHFIDDPGRLVDFALDRLKEVVPVSVAPAIPPDGIVVPDAARAD